ncbi:MAG TPA: ATP-binding protein, partial [Anaeromyxobacteraceae bacterium]|nr:ATP-binding protein [Anaeromyxobacteraceae bacterium]
PFRLLSGLVADIVALARRNPKVASAVGNMSRDQKEILCAVIPELTALFGPVLVRQSGPEDLGESRTVWALASLLAALGTEEQPALVLLDDCQWVSDIVLKLLKTFQELAACAERPCHLLLVVAFRSDEVPETHPLRRFAGVPTLALPPLEDWAIGTLLESMAAGSLPAEAVAVGQRLSAGNPFMAAAVLRGMIECGALVAHGESFHVEPAAIREVRSSREAAVFLLRRMEQLPAHVQRLLSVGAVLGREFDVEFAAALSGQSSAELLGALAEARTRHIVWFRDRGDHLVFAHDKLREALLASLSDDVRKQLHLQAAIRLERTEPGRSFEIAHHFDSAGIPQRALPHALRAAAEARSRHALDVAEQHYRLARRGAAKDDEGTRFHVAEGLGDVLMLRGQYGNASSEFLEARLSAHGPIDRARIEGKLGELAFKSGDMDAASHRVENGLSLLGRRVPPRNSSMALWFAWEAFIQVLHTLLPRAFVGRHRTHASEADSLAIHLYSRLAHVYWFQRGNVATLWAHLREMNLAERHPPTLDLAQAYSEHAPVMTMLAWFSRGIAYAKRSYEIRKALHDTWGQGQSLHFLGVVLYGASRFEESIESCSQAIRILERMGDQWEVNTARWHIAYGRYRLGSLRAAVDEARRVFRGGAEIGDAQARGIGLAIWAKASSGRVPEDAIRHELLQGAGGVHTRVEVLQAEALRLLALNRPADATAVLRDARDLIDRARIRQEYVAPVLPWLATALRRQIENTPPHAPAQRAALLREALAVARQAVRLARSYHNNLAHALRERALLLTMRGRPREARRFLNESVNWAERLGMREEAAQSRLARGQIGLLEGWRGAEEDIATANPVLQAMRNELGLASAAAVGRDSISTERLGGIVDACRRLTSGRSREQVLAIVREEAAILLGEKRSLVLDVLGDKIEPAAQEDQASFSVNVVRRMLAQGKLLALAADEDATPDVTRGHAVICAPVRARGRIAACLYVVRREPGRPFHEVETRLADLLTSVAGAALEIADLLGAEEHRADFIGVLSHELRNPLASICSCAHILGRALPGSERDLRARAIIERQVGQLARFTNDLLDMTRVSRGELHLRREEVRLNDLLLGAAEDQGWAFANRGVELELAIGNEPIRLNADGTRLAQAIGHLLENAAKFTPRGGRATLSVKRGQGEVEISVRDTGRGIEPPLLERLFEPFVQGDKTLARSDGGLGLGLALVRNLVELHGGTVRAFSEGMGKGAVFIVRLPAHTAHAGEVRSSSQCDPCQPPLVSRERN